MANQDKYKGRLKFSDLAQLFVPGLGCGIRGLCWPQLFWMEKETE
jgi:hypothetical protein